MGAKGDLGIELDLDKVPCREDGHDGLRDDAVGEPGAHAHGARARQGEARPRRSSANGASTSRSSARPPTPALRRHAPAAKSWPTCRSRISATRRRNMTGRMSRNTEPARIAARRASRPRCRHAEALLKLIGSPDLCSKRWVWEQYDHLILGNTVQRPGGDAAVVRVEDGPKGLAFTSDVTPRYCEADPFEGGKQAVAEAWRNLTAVGARAARASPTISISAIPERPEIMGQFVGCIARHRRSLPGARFPGRLRQCLALQRDQRPRHPADARDRRRRPDRRCRQIAPRSPSRREGEAILLIGATAGLARPIASICAISAAARTARRRRSTSPTRSASAISSAAHPRRAGDRRARPLRWRPCRRARRDGDGGRHRRRDRRRAGRRAPACLPVRRGPGAATCWPCEDAGRVAAGAGAKAAGFRLRGFGSDRRRSLDCCRGERAHIWLRDAARGRS